MAISSHHQTQMDLWWTPQSKFTSHRWPFWRCWSMAGPVSRWRWWAWCLANSSTITRSELTTFSRCRSRVRCTSIRLSNLHRYSIWSVGGENLPLILIFFPGTGVSVEAVDPVFQAKMLDMLKQTGRPEMVVGWYHSHPGFGCWLSGVDINTQQSFEQLTDRAVAVVIDPIQSVKGKVVIDAFRWEWARGWRVGKRIKKTFYEIE